MRRPVMAVAAVALVAALFAAGCGGGSGSGGGYGESSNAAETSGSSGGGYGRSYPTSSSGGESSSGGGTSAVVSVGSVPKLGKVLVDSEGFTLYDFGKDKGTKSTCYGTCAQDWPPLLTSGAAKVSNGASMSKLGTTKRNDGTEQVTYAGHPLYTFFEDTKPGEAKGNDLSFFGGKWYALTPQGTEPGE